MYRQRISWFFLGSACFIISQVLLRIPLLEQLQKSTDYMLVYVLNPLLVGILIAFSAGIFEEGFRFLFKRFIIRPRKSEFAQPIIFGLGHGITEATIILGSAMTIAPVSQLGVAILERVLAIILHVALTVVVWNGFQKKKRVLYLFIAIAIHGLVNSLIPLLASLPNSIIVIEGALVIIDVAMIIYIYYSKKYYVY